MRGTAFLAFSKEWPTTPFEPRRVLDPPLHDVVLGSQGASSSTSLAWGTQAVDDAQFTYAYRLIIDFLARRRNLARELQQLHQQRDELEELAGHNQRVHDLLRILKWQDDVTALPETFSESDGLNELGAALRAEAAATAAAAATPAEESATARPAPREGNTASRDKGKGRAV